MFGSCFCAIRRFLQVEIRKVVPMTSFSLSRRRYPFLLEASPGAGGSCRVFQMHRAWIQLGVWAWHVGFDFEAWIVSAEIAEQSPNIFGSRHPVASESIIRYLSRIISG